ncbi:hypothetical protein JEQ00_04880 [Serratia marcescens]|uniref:hypothetical protein n=1 Tax=Serratia marcescens TaxID=615 RepID=UPI001A27E1B4|nr:hypothetical protein [Serratia marcescens]MBI6170324.1 hypothetical protein [Serratia marcescens]CAI1609183.1 Uncharacterised protein [Serratia marcescens]
MIIENIKTNMDTCIECDDVDIKVALLAKDVVILTKSAGFGEDERFYISRALSLAIMIIQNGRIDITNLGLKIN